jgi:ABC-type oligopeptide transport system ATPase subunit
MLGEGHVSPSATPPVVRIEGLVKRLGRNVTAVDGLDLVVEERQVVGLAGPIGSGKSVTLKVLLGLMRPTAGCVLLFGEPVRPGADVLGRVGALVDGPGLVPYYLSAVAVLNAYMPNNDVDLWQHLFQQPVQTDGMFHFLALQGIYSGVFLGLAWWWFMRKDVVE